MEDASIILVMNLSLFQLKTCGMLVCYMDYNEQTEDNPALNLYWSTSWWGAYSAKACNRSAKMATEEKVYLD